MNISRVCCVGLAACLLAFTASAQSIWKWRDRDGRIQVSDRPPPVDVPDSAILQRPGGVKPTVVELDKPAPADVMSSAPLRVEGELDARKRKLQAEQAAQQQAKQQADKEQQAAKKADNCTRARNQLAALESGQRIARPNEKGERELLDDRGRADEIKRTRDVVASSCQ